MRKIYRVIIQENLSPVPNSDEIVVAQVIANYFRCDVSFLQPSRQRTPDLFVAKQHRRWEIKNVRGNSKRTIANNLRSAKYQSPLI